MRPVEDALKTLFEASDSNERFSAWQSWKQLATDAGEAELLKTLTDTRYCKGCKYLEGDWCVEEDLPCAVNPAVIRNYVVRSVACMGRFFEKKRSKHLSCLKEV